MKFLNTVDLAGSFRFNKVVDVGTGNTTGHPVDVSNANYVILTPWDSATSIYEFTNAIVGQFFIVENYSTVQDAIVKDCGTIPPSSARAAYCYIISFNTPIFRLI